MRKVKLLLAGLFMIITGTLNAQLPNLDSVKAELYKVNRVFDSSQYLGFDVNIVYASDTLYGKFEHDEMSGKYILNNRNLYYKMGNMEYTKNDSFVYNIYHDEKMMMMTKDVLPANSSVFPLKEFVDSIITWYDTAYTITIMNVEDSKMIEFKAKISGLPYQRFAVYYETSSHYPDKFEMTLKESLNEINDIPDSILQIIKSKPVEKRITMSFSNYYHPQTLEVFDNGSYVYFDRKRKKYIPIEKLKAYRFITNGVEGEEYNEAVELSSPDGNE
jgi:hypothetical protein